METIYRSRQAAHRLNALYGAPFRKLFLAVAVAVFLLNGCVETIDFDVDRAGNQLVVDGIITDSPGPYRLKLRRTSDQPKITNPVVGATITVTDGEGNREVYYETNDGTYEVAGAEVEGVRGGTYQVEISLRNGKTYRSDLETIPEVTARDSIYYEFDTIKTYSEHGVEIEKEVMRVYKQTFVPESDRTLYLKWTLQGAYKFTEFDFPDFLNAPPRVCYVTETPEPQDIHLYDGSELTGGNLKPQVMAERQLNYAFQTRYYANLIQYSVTARAHTYWVRVDQAVNQAGTIFDVPPANAAGNVYNVNDAGETVLGYFQAAAVDTTRFFVTQNDLPFRIFEHCRTPDRSYCSDCLEIDNSSRQPPFYWLQD